MKPISKLGKRACKNLKGIFTDIDDTLSLDGKISANAYAALWKARKAGLHVIPITGRPAGWCDHIARMWPVDAVIGENGAFYDYLDLNIGRDGKHIRRYIQDEETRERNHARLWRVFQELKNKMPGLQVASDQGYRAIDIAIDFCEDVTRLNDGEIDFIARSFREAGAQAKISSIHVNAWFGDHDKFTTCCLLLDELFGEKFADVRDQYIYFGDSPNDEPLFEKFNLSVGVANIRDFADRIEHMPGFVTKSPGGEGFAEAVKHILGMRKS